MSYDKIQPMPTEVLAAYRDPLDLRALLASGVFTDSDRLSVRDELLDRLIAKHGNVEVEIGDGSKTLSIRKRIAQFKKNAWGSIAILLRAEEFGGTEAVLLELAAVMQPYWIRWWESMEWEDIEEPRRSLMIANSVLGSRQLTWIAAQYARSVLDLDSVLCKKEVLGVIEAAESWSSIPSHSTRMRLRKTTEDATERGNYYSFIDESSSSAAYAAYALGRVPSAEFQYKEAWYALLNAFTAVDNADRPAFCSKACSLTKRLITPTLITSASRGLR